MISIDYIAGIIDGEGSIKIHKNKVQITISNTNMEMLEKIRKYLNFGNVGSYPKRKENWKSEGRYLTRNNDEAKTLLMMLDGKLIIKQKKCADALKVLENYEKFLVEQQLIKTEAIKLLGKKSHRQIAQQFNLSHTTIDNWSKE